MTPHDAALQAARDAGQQIAQRKYNLRAMMQLHEPPKIYEDGGEFNDASKDLKDVCTKIVTDEFFSTRDTVEALLDLVLGAFGAALDAYCAHANLDRAAITFVYKGGNVLRIFQKHALHAMPHSIAQRLGKRFNPYFKKSDCDFSLLVDPTLERYDEVFEHATQLAHLVVAVVRDALVRQRCHFVNFFRYNVAYGTALLRRYLPDLQATHVAQARKWTFHSLGFANAGTRHHTRRGDIAVVPTATLPLPHRTTAGGTGVVPLTAPPHVFYVSVNRALDFQRTNKRTRFHLCRIKANFVLVYDAGGRRRCKEVGGEVVDVAIPHRSTDGFNASMRQRSTNLAPRTLR